MIEIKVDMGDDCVAVFKISDGADIYKVRDVLRCALLSATFVDKTIDNILVNESEDPFN